MKNFSDLLTPLVPGLYLLPAANGGRFPQSHCFVVRDEVEALIDAGAGIERLQRVAREWRPDRVIASHSHPDHCSGLWIFAGVRLTSPWQHADIFWRMDAMADRLSAPGELAAMYRQWVAATMGIRDVTSDDHFDDLDVFDFGRVKFTALRMPGHLEDHYIFFEPHHGLALTFDIDLTGFGPWYGHPEADVDLFIADIQRLIDLRPRLLVTSHKGLIDAGIQERLRAYRDIFFQRDRMVRELLAKPRTLAELVDASPFYRGHPYMPPVMRFWEGVMIDKHLQRLARDGKAVCAGERWRRR